MVTEAMSEEEYEEFPNGMGTVTVGGPQPDYRTELMDSVMVAEFLKVSRENVRQMVFKKQLTVVGREKRKALFRREDVEAIATLRSMKKRV